MGGGVSQICSSIHPVFFRFPVLADFGGAAPTQSLRTAVSVKAVSYILILFFSLLPFAFLRLDTLLSCVLCLCCLSGPTKRKNAAFFLYVIPFHSFNTHIHSPPHSRTRTRQ
jgi:hypothetical protein